MKKVTFFFILMIFISITCHGEITFEQEFSFPSEMGGNYYCNYWLLDLNEDGQDEVYVSYIFYEGESWCLVEYDLSGDTTAVFEEELEPEVLFSGCSLVRSEDTVYLLAVYDRQSDNYLKFCDLKVYDYNTMTIIDSASIEIGEWSNIFGDYFSTNYVEIVEETGINNLYLGIFKGYELDEAGWGDTKAYKYSFDQGMLSFIEEIPDCGGRLYKPADTDFLIAIGSSFSWSFDTDPFYSYSLNRLSYDSPTEVEEILFVLDREFLSFFYMNENDLHYQDYGPVIWESENNMFHCYSPDLTEIVWEDSIESGTGFQMKRSTCVSTNLGDNFILYFYAQENISYAGIRNRINGHIVLTEEVGFSPDKIFSGSGNELYFFDRVGDWINVYTLAEEIQLGSDYNEIAMNNYELSNFPNPFNPETVISFNLQVEADVELAIYNLKGEKVKVLMKEHFAAGEHSALWQGRNESNNKVSSGIYFIRLMSNGESGGVEKCLLFK